jgi:hypothetical protein
MSGRWQNTPSGATLELPWITSPPMGPGPPGIDFMFLHFRPKTFSIFFSSNFDPKHVHLTFIE